MTQDIFKIMLGIIILISSIYLIWYEMDLIVSKIAISIWTFFGVAHTVWGIDFK